jgi:hypothetical protein
MLRQMKSPSRDRARARTWAHLPQLSNHHTSTTVLPLPLGSHIVDGDLDAISMDAVTLWSLGICTTG